MVRQVPGRNGVAEPVLDERQVAERDEQPPGKHDRDDRARSEPEVATAAPGERSEREQRRDREEEALALRESRRAQEERPRHERPALAGGEPPARTEQPECDEERERDVREAGRELLQDGLGAQHGERRRADERERHAVSQQRHEAEQETEREQRELHVDERRVVRAHRTKVDRIERREQQRMLQRKVDVAREDRARRTPELVERARPRPPDRPAVPLEERADLVRRPGVRKQDERDGERTSADEAAPEGLHKWSGTCTRPANPPEPDEEGDRGQHHELDQAQWDVDQRDVRCDDPGRRDADGVGERQTLDERGPIWCDAEERQQPGADHEEEPVREQEPDHDGSLTRPT
jgi:hypothetical protein